MLEFKPCFVYICGHIICESYVSGKEREFTQPTPFSTTQPTAAWHMAEKMESRYLDYYSYNNLLIYAFKVLARVWFVYVMS